jgi:uncharacterized RDD family membrane protein YckC
MSGRPILEGVRARWNEAAAPALEAPELYEGIRSRRTVGYLIDLALLAIAALLWWTVGGLLTFITLGLLHPLLILGGVLLPFAYHTWFIGGEQAATPGMRVTGLRAVTTDGGRPSYFQAFVLTALFYFSVGATSWLILLVSLFNPRGRCAHDFFAGVLIVRADARPRVAYAVE